MVITFFTGINHITMLLPCLTVFLFLCPLISLNWGAIQLSLWILSQKAVKNISTHYRTWEQRILIDVLKFYAWSCVWANSMPESVDFCWFYICHNDYQELHCIVQTGRLLLCVHLPGFDILVLRARTFFKIFGEDSVCLSKKQHKLLFFATHSRV